MVYNWFNKDNNWNKFRAYGTHLFQPCQRVIEIGYATILPTQINTKPSESFVRYSAWINPPTDKKAY